MFFTRIITDSGVVGPMFFGGQGQYFSDKLNWKTQIFFPHPPSTFFVKKISGRNVKIAFVALFLN
jgi:hypothetical protein